MITPSPRRKARFPLPLFLVLLFGLPIAWLAYAAVHGHRLFQDPLPVGAMPPTR